MVIPDTLAPPRPQPRDRAASEERILAAVGEVLALPPAERYALFFRHFIDELRVRPLMLGLPLVTATMPSKSLFCRG